MRTKVSFCSVAFNSSENEGNGLWLGGDGGVDIVLFVCAGLFDQLVLS